jgi:hypothetical protein
LSIEINNINERCSRVNAQQFEFKLVSIRSVKDFVYAEV